MATACREANMHYFFGGWGGGVGFFVGGLLRLLTKGVGFGSDGFGVGLGDGLQEKSPIVSHLTDIFIINDSSELLLQNKFTIHFGFF